MYPNPHTMPAHTIVRVPLHVDRLPATVRRQLAANGPRVAIGCRYQPAIVITPAVTVFKRRRRKMSKYAVGILAACFLYALGALASWGLA